MEKRRVPLPPPLPTFVLRSFPAGVCCVKYDSKDPLRLFTGDQQGSIELFNLETRRSMWKVTNAHQSNVLDLHQTNQIEDRLITLGKDGFVQLWNFQGENQWKYQTNHCSFSNCDVVSSNLIVVPVGNSESAVAALDHRSPAVVARKFLPRKETSNSFGMVMKLRAMGDDFLCVAYENGSLSIFQVSTGEQFDSYQVTSDHQPITALDTYQHTCLCGNTSSTLISLDFLSSKLQATENFRSVNLPNPGTSFIRCRPNDGKLMAAAGWDSRIRLFRRETGKQLAMLDFHQQQVNSIDFQHSTQQMACASSDRTVSIWDLYQNQVITNKN